MNDVILFIKFLLKKYYEIELRGVNFAIHVFAFMVITTMLIDEDSHGFHSDFLMGMNLYAFIGHGLLYVAHPIYQMYKGIVSGSSRWREEFKEYKDSNG